MKQLKLALSFVICAALVVLGQKIIMNSIAHQDTKIDNAEVNHIKYGLFSVNRWKEQLAVIIVEEIGKLNLTHANERELKKHVEVQLNGLIDQVEIKIKESNKGSTKGWIKQRFINAFVDVKDIKNGIPQYADAIITEMTKAKTEADLKAMVIKRIEAYFEKTFESQDLTRLNRILKKIDAPDIEHARVILGERNLQEKELIYRQTWALIALAFLLFGLAGFSKDKMSSSQFTLLMLTLLVLLLAGVTTPMIDMEAKISKMSFQLLDHAIVFENQVLYYQSKSILDVFWIMVTHHDLQMRIVGLLMVAFSIVFPIFKMLSSLVYYTDWNRGRTNAIVKFFVFKSGKWSMTDVQIVAIFMAYIGFNGIITSQFGNLSSTNQELVILTTNGTSLQPGFYIFLSYTLLALFLSGFLLKKYPAPEV